VTIMARRKPTEDMHRHLGPLLLKLQEAAETVDNLTASLKSLNLSDDDWKDILSGFKLSPEIRRRVVGNDCITDMVEYLESLPNHEASVEQVERELLNRGQEQHRIRQSISQNAGLKKRICWADSKKSRIKLVKK